MAGPQGRPKGSTDTSQRTRRKQTEDERKSSNDKRADTMKKKEKAEKAKNKANFFGLYAKNNAVDDTFDVSNPAEEEEEIECSKVGGYEDDDDDDRVTVRIADSTSMVKDGTDDSDDDSSDEDVEILNHEAIFKTVNHPPIVAALEEVDGDYDPSEDEDEPSDPNPPAGDAGTDKPTGVMATYIEKVYERLRYELTGKCGALEESWLMKYLKSKKNDFWIRAHDAEDVCKRLKIAFDEPSYYRDIRVWLPDEQYGLGLMPCCPSCHKNTNIGPHGYRDNHFARRIVTCKSNYYIMSRRYVCRDCMSKRAKETKEATATMMQVAEQNNIEVEIVPNEKKEQYTFMGYNPTSVSLLPFGKGDEFPAFLTHRGAVDKEVIDWMLPLYNKGVRPEALSDIILEHHSKEFTRKWKRREHQIEEDLMLRGTSPLQGVMYSEFSDKSKYDGAVPTGKYLLTVYKQYQSTIKPQLVKEVKKRGARRLHWDVSYKEAKHLCQYRGKPVYKGLVTATNEYGEIRLQFHVVTDGQDQMKGAIAAFLNTVAAYGQPPVDLLTTDNPAADDAFFKAEIPSLQAAQERLNAAGALDEQTEMAHSFVPQRFIRVASATSDINNVVMSLRTHFNSLPPAKRILGLDCEWEVTKNRRGFITKSHKLAVIQLAYVDHDGNVRVIVLQVHKHKTLPYQLKCLLEDDSIKFAGVGVGGDLAKIGTDLDCEDTIAGICLVNNVINLGSYARHRDAIQDGTIGLAELTRIVLQEHLAKPPHVRISKWAATNLTKEQIRYAAIDAAVSLRIYLQLEIMPDLNARLQPNEAIAGAAVDIVPKNGSAANMATRAGWGKISSERWYNSPAGMTPQRTRAGRGRAGRARGGKERTVIVEVETVTASHLVIPNMRTKKGEKATLADFGTTPFSVVLPISMLRPHVESDSIRSTEYEPPPARASTDSETSPPAPSAASPAETLTPAVDRLKAAADEASDAATATGNDAPLQCAHLDPPPKPKDVQNVFSSVLGDGFHSIDRPKVPIKHELKKAFKVAFQEAFFAWNPPRQLYWRVRATFVLFGDEIDSKTKKPLFNKAAWKKANNLLKEILLGYYSDPPGISFTYGTWHTGVEMSDCLLAEMRHRHNHRCSERRRLDFPRVGHYDTWLIDSLQTLVMKNHGVLLYSGWTNASDYKDTPESFGTVALHDQDLADAVAEAFVGGRCGEKENKLWARLILESPMDDEAMALEWCKYVDGIHIFPKLPVHIRIHREEWERNQRVRDAVKKAEAGVERLAELNAALAPAAASTDTDIAAPDAATDAASQGTSNESASETTPQVPYWPMPTYPTIMAPPIPQARHNFPFVTSNIQQYQLGYSYTGTQENPETRNAQKIMVVAAAVTKLTHAFNTLPTL